MGRGPEETLQNNTRNLTAALNTHRREKEAGLSVEGPCVLRVIFNRARASLMWTCALRVRGYRDTSLLRETLALVKRDGGRWCGV